MTRMQELFGAFIAAIEETPPGADIPEGELATQLFEAINARVPCTEDEFENMVSYATTLALLFERRH